MTSVISKFVVKTLCDLRGSLDFQRRPLRRRQSIHPGGPIESRRGTNTRRDSLIVAKSSLRVCQRRPGECPRCDALHICKFYVCGELLPYIAPYGRKQVIVHLDLTEKQLFQLLLQNDPYLLPEVSCTSDGRRQRWIC
uniref:PARP12-like CCCH zinc finger tandem domain-containing protein n=1 Tax=Gasterosteus aculeatus aculeatus TaxID=481459 RepID=A0AAQ4NT29_GASAC